MSVERIYVFVAAYIFLFAQVLVCSERELTQFGSSIHEKGLQELDDAPKSPLTHSILIEDGNKCDAFKEQSKEHDEDSDTPTNTTIIDVDNTVPLIHVNINHKQKSKKKQKKQKKSTHNDTTIIKIFNEHGQRGTSLGNSNGTNYGILAELALECTNLFTLRLCKGLVTIILIIIILYYVLANLKG